MSPEFHVRIPATSANLGPGFDCMGLALDLRNQFRVVPQSRFEITVRGIASTDISCTRDNLVVQAANVLMKHVGSQLSTEDWRIDITTSIPSASGLGSSASAIAAGMLLANEIVGFYEPNRQLQRHAVVELATQMEGHPDNVTPALLGGAWLSLYDAGRLRSFSLNLPANLAFTVATPNVKVSTDESRKLLSSTVSRQDAVYNAAQAARLVLALERSDLTLLGSDFGDRVHEPSRTAAIPHYNAIMTGAQQAGAAAVTLSGSGPSLLTWCDGTETARRVQATIRQLWTQRGVEGSVEIYAPLTSQPSVEITEVKEAKL